MRHPTRYEHAEDDPDVKIPAAVKAAAARSEELYHQYRDPNQDEPETPPENTPEEEDTSPGNPDLDPSTLAKAEEQPAKPEQSEEPEKKTDKEPGEKEQDDPDSWENRYKAMHGRYRKSQEQLREMSERIQSLQNVIATMQTTSPQDHTKDEPESEPERLLTEEELSDYGEDFLRVVGKRAREELSPVINGYKSEIAQLKKQLEGFTGYVQQDAQQKLLSTLDEKLPSWRELNSNKEFLEWLSLPDPYSGAIRHEMLKAAYTQGDAHRVLAFFNGFLAEEAALAPAGKEPDPTTKRMSKVSLQNLAAPGRAKTAAASAAPAEKPIITRAQIASFYADVAAGKYRGKTEEKDRLESMIFEAERDGRIR